MGCPADFTRPLVIKGQAPTVLSLLAQLANSPRSNTNVISNITHITAQLLIVENEVQQQQQERKKGKQEQQQQQEQEGGEEGQQRQQQRLSELAALVLEEMPLERIADLGGPKGPFLQVGVRGLGSGQVLGFD